MTLALALWWMGLRRAETLVRVYAALPCFALLLLLSLVLADAFTRATPAAPWR